MKPRPHTIETNRSYASPDSFESLGRSSKPVGVIVGLPAQTLQPIPGQVPLAWVVGQQYVRALTTSGAIPWVIPLLDDDLAGLRAIYDRLDGLLLAGGVDIEPSEYGENRIEQCGQSDQARDRVEIQLIRWAQEDRMPVLGVCRGAQMINVALGGNLYQDLAAQLPTAQKHDFFPQQGFQDRGMLAHSASIAETSKLFGIMGPTVKVNSMHHQGIKSLGKGLAAVAHAPDGVVEGLEGVNGQFLVGVQWHPEELLDGGQAMKMLFDSFVTAAREFRRLVRRTPADSA